MKAGKHARDLRREQDRKRKEQFASGHAAPRVPSPPPHPAPRRIAPAPVETLLDVSQLRVLCSRVGVTQVTCKGAVMTMKMDPAYVPDGTVLLAAMARTDKRLTLTPRGPTAMVLRGAWKNEREALTEGVKVMAKLNEKLDEVTGKEAIG